MSSSARAQDQEPSAPAANPVSATPAPVSASAPATPAPADAGGAQEQKIGPWRAISSVDGKGRAVTELRLAAAHPYTDAKSKEFTPELVLICQRNGNTTVYIDMQNPIGSPDDETVQLQYGSTGAYPVRTEWNLSKTRTKVISPDSLNLVTDIRERHSLDFQITPYEVPSISVFFQLDDIEQAFGYMSERCYQ